MAESSIRIRAELKGDVAEVKCLMSHEMETGLRKDKKTNEVIPAWFIKDVNCEVNGKAALVAHWGPAVSKNPYLAFFVKGVKSGDTVKVSWIDTKDATDSAEAAIK